MTALADGRREAYARRPNALPRLREIPSVATPYRGGGQDNSNTRYSACQHKLHTIAKQFRHV